MKPAPPVIKILIRSLPHLKLSTAVQPIEFFFRIGIVDFCAKLPEVMPCNIRG
jgi:hypothetical protein